MSWNSARSGEGHAQIRATYYNNNKNYHFSLFLRRTKPFWSETQLVSSGVFPWGHFMGLNHPIDHPDWPFRDRYLIQVGDRRAVECRTMNTESIPFWVTDGIFCRRVNTIVQRTSILYNKREKKKKQKERRRRKGYKRGFQVPGKSAGLAMIDIRYAEWFLAPSCVISGLPGPWSDRL